MFKVTGLNARVTVFFETESDALEALSKIAKCPVDRLILGQHWNDNAGGRRYSLVSVPPHATTLATIEEIP